MRISDWSSDVCSSDLLIFGHQFADAVERAVERPGIGRMVGHQLRQPVDLAIAHLEHAAGVLEHCARLQFPEGDDLRDRVAAVFFLYITEIGRAAWRERVCQYV